MAGPSEYPSNVLTSVRVGVFVIATVLMLVALCVRTHDLSTPGWGKLFLINYFGVALLGALAFTWTFLVGLTNIK